MRGKGVYIDDVYANGRLDELIGCEVIEVTANSDSDSSYLTIESITLEDGDNRYDVENIPFYDE